MNIIRHLAAGALSFLATAAIAADFDGSRPLICAPVSAIDCARGDECLAGLPEDIGAPAFMRLDFAKKTVTGPKSTSPILLQEKSTDQLLLQGREGPFGWTMALQSNTGEMTLSLISAKAAYTLFGSCTPL
jgi:hypothetical protein